MATTVGPEQEYFLIDKEDYDKRLDLVLTGRTLFGSAPSKGQELEEHYFGTIRPIVSEFMKDLDEELWKLGVPAKTKHNEVAPCQHELAPIYDTTNVAIDHNLLTMEMMKKIASKHGLVCLQHEKPFAGVNGSRQAQQLVHQHRHGREPAGPRRYPDARTLQFMLFLSAVIKAVDEYQPTCCASPSPPPGNDHRLGANEAPPAIISIFVGEELEAVIDAVCIEIALCRTRQDERWTSASTSCPSSARTPPTATAPPRSPSPATSSSSVCPAPSEYHVRRQHHPEHRRCRRACSEFADELEGAADFECAAARLSQEDR